MKSSRDWISIGGMDYTFEQTLTLLAVNTNMTIKIMFFTESDT